MEILVTHEIERKKDGSRIVRNFFFNNDNTNRLVESQKHFSKSQKKEAKANYKLSLNQNIMHKTRRKELVSHLVNCEIPNWNIKLGFI